MSTTDWILAAGVLVAALTAVLGLFISQRVQKVVVKVNGRLGKVLGLSAKTDDDKPQPKDDRKD